MDGLIIFLIISGFVYIFVALLCSLVAAAKLEKIMSEMQEDGINDECEGISEAAEEAEQNDRKQNE